MPVPVNKSKKILVDRKKLEKDLEGKKNKLNDNIKKVHNLLQKDKDDPIIKIIEEWNAQLVREIKELEDLLNPPK
jgi:hypothetical protein